LKCHYEYIKGLRVFIPGCMGGAVYGLDGCFCSNNHQSKNDLYEMIQDLTERIDELERKEYYRSLTG
jgi:hypothetical protein